MFVSFPNTSESFLFSITKQEMGIRVVNFYYYITNTSLNNAHLNYINVMTTLNRIIEKNMFTEIPDKLTANFASGSFFLNFLRVSFNLLILLIL